MGDFPVAEDFLVGLFVHIERSDLTVNKDTRLPLKQVD